MWENMTAIATKSSSEITAFPKEARRKDARYAIVDRIHIATISR